MKMSESIDALAKALAAAQAEIENATKGSINPHFRNKYADLAEILNTARPVLSKHGISVVQMPGFEDGKVSVETVLMHESGQWISNTLLGPCAKLDPQGVGSAITYYRRYSLAAFAGIAQEDDDANEASQPGANNRQSAPQYINKVQQNRLEAVLNTCSPAVQKKFESDYPDASKVTIDVFEGIVNSLEAAAKKYQERKNQDYAA
ncbi:ERF superfamily protein [Pseudomonas duriflava]|uniref:ERF superfamily protein n=1 Tax=Pseudomonas duriflava TaxID=459528 RepID=A0A562PPD0_9PSED|nr:ERF family protein [Pseudomonas duriflava]TWI46315.1 ERF superfamily protein [Pseudomonas duriflava]